MVHLQLQVVPAPGTRAQPVSMALSADKFQVLLAGKVGPAEVGPLLGLADLELAIKARLASDLPLCSLPLPLHPPVPCRIEASPDHDDCFGLRTVFPASVGPPCLH